ncbi:MULTISPECIES: hypothetical protein [unclassified Mycobacterium]|uniref:hypothetical protein n=1 Tax=unclassified Mycobacterium TaxID=2642494 RepID=UPI000A412E03|nr:MULTISPECIES: hypothetical protein [unclassified Mycobacterium]
MTNLTMRRLRPVLRLVPHSRRRGRHRALPYDLPAVRITSARLDHGSTVPLCAMCIEAGLATEATYQTSGLVCGCDRHIYELERDGRAAIHRQRKLTAAT